MHRTMLKNGGDTTLFLALKNTNNQNYKQKKLSEKIISDSPFFLSN